VTTTDDNILTISRPGKPDLEFHQCKLSMVAVGDTIIMPDRKDSAGGNLFAKVGATEIMGDFLYVYTTVRVRVQTPGVGFEFATISDNTSRMTVWVLVP
jgi:hypothetical protein